ncbi:peptidase S41 [Emticicia oligotrophica DSM 17448]|uniref:Tricorn protease homolog n=1 Tax=Emticicia oligotrophica (strain DSM 17448 / CIP 109782 / MTCC 6937 / GPTSA100-15) TaxID=929562 RepID=A0ABM5N433_EMTOG|nr:S41 family peptidase [Emticicia oligotrophica]AFK04244.1 peptidase S41 [Emticicia oligotrophica DSM 17448]
MKKTLLTAAILSCTSLFIQAQNNLLLRQPAINKDGSVVAFSFQGDIWTVPSSGGKATRLTIHEAYESNPVFSPDGNQIAFSGARFGNNDVFVMPTEGGMAKRLTYHSGNDLVSSWTQADKIVFSTNREFKQIERPNEVYAINPKGGTEFRVLDAVGFDPVYSPDGRFMVFVRGDINPVARQEYKGSSDRDLWLYDNKNKTFLQLPGFETNDVFPQWVGNNTVYFLSSNEGVYNIYRLKIDANGKAMDKPEKLTNYKDESIRAFSVSADGNSIVFEKDMNLYTMKINGGSAQKLNVKISADERLDASEQKTFTSGANEYAVSPNGKLLAYSIRGEIFVKEADKEKSRSINVSEHPFRDIEPTWLNDSTLLFSSDRNNGNFDIYMVRSTDSTQRNIFKSLKHEIVQLTKTPGDETSMSVSGDGKKIAYVRGRGTFVVADITTDGKLSNEKILNDSWASPSGIVWSPDNKWLAYSLEDLYFNEEIFIQAADNSTKAVNVSMHPRTDRRPFWSADGSKLGFLSERSVGRSFDVWFAWLKKEDWEKETQDWQERDTPAAEAAPAKPNDKKDKTPKPIKIDFDKIHERVVQVTNFTGDESDLVISKDGETFYYTTASSNAKGRDLYSIKWDGKDLKEITKGGANPSGVTMDKDGKYLYYARQGALARIDVKSNVSESLPFVAKMKIDYMAERTQVFEEAWRTIRDGFYDPKFHGNDWVKLHDKYKERCINASTGNDFRDMFNLLLGELNSSHMGLTVTERADTQRESTGLLGTELVPVAGGVRINHVVPETPADKEKSKLNEGDVIIAVNGEAVAENGNFYELLNGLVNEKVLLTVKATDGKTREVAIRLTASIANNLYEEWVEGRKKLVEKYSNGRLGYIHIKGMDFPSFEVVEREFTAAGYGKDGIIIDVRYNGGGSTTDYLMTILNYKQHAYTIPRGASNDLEKDKLKFRDYYPLGERLVYAAWTKPSIALCNEGSYSNAEIFSHAYKSLGIGKLVGVPTNGSVISTGGKGLMDGSFVRLPFRGWFTKATDKNQELGPAIPDIIVENQPDWIAKGTDDQLKAAVDELLKEINSKK